MDFSCPEPARCPRCLASGKSVFTGFCAAGQALPGRRVAAGTGGCSRSCKRRQLGSAGGVEEEIRALPNRRRDRRNGKLR